MVIQYINDNLNSLGGLRPRFLGWWQKAGGSWWKLLPFSLDPEFMRTPPNLVKMYQVRLVTKIRYIRIFRLKNLHSSDDTI
jgi:hypothetical protein